MAGVVPGVQQQSPLVLVDQAERAEDLVGSCGGQLAEVAQEAVEVRVDRVRCVELRVGVEVDLQTVAVGPVVDDHGHVVGRSDGQVVDDGAVPAEGQVVVEHHDVDLRSDQPLVVGEEVQVAAQVLVPVALVPQVAAHGGGGVAQQLADGHVVVRCEAQRQDVGDHAGGGARGAAEPGGDRQAEDDLVAAGAALQIRGEGGGQQRRPRHLGGAGQVAQCVGRRPVEVRGAAFEAVRGGGAAAGEAGGLRCAGHPVRPVRAVGGEAVGGAVRGVGVDQRRERDEGRRRRLVPRRQRGVDLGGPPGHQRDGEAVDGAVVVGMQPQVVVVRQPEQDEVEERIAADVLRCGQQVPHPQFRRRARIRLRRDVQDRKAPVADRGDPLPGAVGGVREPHAQALRLGQHAQQRGLEDRRVHPAADLQVLAGVVDDVGRVEFLREPDPGLRGGQRQEKVLDVGQREPPSVVFGNTGAGERYGPLPAVITAERTGGASAHPGPVRGRFPCACTLLQTGPVAAVVRVHWWRRRTAVARRRRWSDGRGVRCVVPALQTSGAAPAAAGLSAARGRIRVDVPVLAAVASRGRGGACRQPSGAAGPARRGLCERHGPAGRRGRGGAAAAVRRAVRAVRPQHGRVGGLRGGAPAGAAVRNRGRGADRLRPAAARPLPRQRGASRRRSGPVGGGAAARRRRRGVPGQSGDA